MAFVCVTFCVARCIALCVDLIVDAPWNSKALCGGRQHAHWGHRGSVGRRFLEHTTAVYLIQCYNNCWANDMQREDIIIFQFEKTVPQQIFLLLRLWLVETSCGIVTCVVADHQAT